MTPSSITSERTAKRKAPVVCVPRADPALEAVAESLRGARARTGMSEQQVVAVLAAEHAFVITVARLRGWERTGVIRIDTASRLADVYGTTVDALAGRRAYRSRRHRPQELRSQTAGP